MKISELLFAERLLSSGSLLSTDKDTSYQLFKNLLAIRKECNAVRDAVNELMKLHGVTPGEGGGDLLDGKNEDFAHAYKQVMDDESDVKIQKVSQEGAFAYCCANGFQMNIAEEFCRIFC